MAPRSSLFALLAGLLLLLTAPAEANIKKIIFLGPNPSSTPSTPPPSALHDVRLDVLKPSDWRLRTHLLAEFPQNDSPDGRPSWVLLDGLTPGQRYEVRICWAATQPTEFTLETHALDAVWSRPDLVSSLAAYSLARRQDPRLRDPGLVAVQKPTAQSDGRVDDAGSSSSGGGGAGGVETSALLMRIFAAADYFTLNETLMASAPPVFVDVILDPYLFNLVPRTLLPPIAYIAVVVVVSWFLGHAVLRWLRAFLAYDAPAPDEKKVQ